MYITIKYRNGIMEINVDTFFPAAQTRFKKLLKVIDLDFEHRDEHIQVLEKYFKKKVQELEQKRIDSGKKLLEYRQKVVDTNVIIESRRHPSGIKLTREELGPMRDNLRQFKLAQAEYTSEFNECIKHKERFLKHLEILKQRR